MGVMTVSASALIRILFSADKPFDRSWSKSVDVNAPFIVSKIVGEALRATRRNVRSACGPAATSTRPALKPRASRSRSPCLGRGVAIELGEQRACIVLGRMHPEIEVHAGLQEDTGDRRYGPARRRLCVPHLHGSRPREEQ